MENRRNLCAQIPETLHAKVRQEQESRGQTLSEFMEQILNEHFTGKDGNSMSGTRTLAFQISEEMFQKLKDYLKRHNLKQKEFVLGLIRTALENEE